MLFTWNPRNIAHIAEHGVTKVEADFVVRRAEPPYPEQRGSGKFRVWGATQQGRLLQVIYVLRSLEELNFDEIPLRMIELLSPDEKLRCVIHARDLTDQEKHQLRRRRR